MLNPKTSVDTALGSRYPEAELGDYQSGRVILSMGAIPDELSNVHQGTVFFEFPDSDVLELSGRHAERLLHGLVTQDIRGLPVGRATWSSAVNRYGRLISDFRVWRTSDASYLLIGPPESGAPLAEHIFAHRVAERIELDWKSPTCSCLVLAGATLEQVLESDASAPELGSLELAGVAIDHGPGPELGVPTRVLVVPNESMAAVTEALVEKGAQAAGTDLYDILRVESGYPLFGYEATADRMPIEVGMTDTVSYLKGCYVGQEVIAMATYRGHPNRLLCGVVFESSDQAPEAGTKLEFESGKPGILTTSVLSPRLGKAAGLAVVHHTCAEPGTVVFCQIGEERIQGELVAFPLVASPST
ncbi:MAG: hypothetical protein CMH54_04135 [Myxococcales bacterium]|nr:hypothetical protein [Myxococcales bacterium]